jgi:hypothetical protein
VIDCAPVIVCGPVTAYRTGIGTRYRASVSTERKIKLGRLVGYVCDSERVAGVRPSGGPR